MRHRLLFVDDEPNALRAANRILHRSYELVTATSGQEGLEALRRRGPFAAIVSDFRMPRMDGIEFLHHARAIAPESVRLMLTGQADLSAAVRAFNTSGLFRFLTKPLRPTDLMAAIEDAIAQHRLLVAERELLEQTLAGSVRALTEVLALVSPLALGRSVRLKRYVSHLARALGVDAPWEFEVAAMLSQVGCTSIPSDTLERIIRGERLDDEEQAVYASHPHVARAVLDGIPRLERAREMIGWQLRPIGELEELRATEDDATAALGALLIRLAVEYDQLLVRGAPPADAVALLRRREPPFDHRLLDALERLESNSEGETVLRSLRVAELRSGMVFDEDVVTPEGILLVSRQQEVTTAVIERLRNFLRGAGVKEPIRVLERQPAPGTEEPATAVTTGEPE
jgi:CheY-like chemotaxis protein